MSKKDKWTCGNISIQERTFRVSLPARCSIPASSDMWACFAPCGKIFWWKKEKEEKKYNRG